MAYCGQGDKLLATVERRGQEAQLMLLGHYRARNTEEEYEKMWR